MKRLLAYTYKLFATAGLLQGTVIRPYGVSPEDLVSEAIKRLLDPNDTTVAWAVRMGRPSNEGVFRYLRKVVGHDFVDHRKAKTQHAKTEGLFRERGAATGGDGLVIDPPDPHSPQEDDLVSKVNRERLLTVLLERASGDTELEEYLLLQCCDGEYLGFTPEEAGAKLRATATNIQNRKRRCRRLLETLAREQGEEARASRGESEDSDEQT